MGPDTEVEVAGREGRVAVLRSIRDNNHANREALKVVTRGMTHRDVEDAQKHFAHIEALLENLADVIEYGPDL
jgi:hypothetical protein